MALLNRSGSDTSAMRAVARQRENYTHDVKVGDHVITVDEPAEQGGDDLGPSPQELLAAALASCTAVTMEMYAKRKGWDTSGLAVDVRYIPALADAADFLSECLHPGDVLLTLGAGDGNSVGEIVLKSLEERRPE